ncbi:MAG: winged helix-turn-helix domain-containing protein [Gemmatimonadetes bacterium]|nr:MAG: winged helix-turn-helix domain-containing protein [Gemmatimonadota bacterium]
MTLKPWFLTLLRFFADHHMDYAIVGAFALHAYGYTRTTRDLDFITREAYQPAIQAFLEAQGFETLHQSAGFSNHFHWNDRIRVDLIYVDSPTGDHIFNETRLVTFFDDVPARVVSPTHLMALKLFAIRNDPERTFKELADIKKVIELTHISPQTVRNYLKKYDLERFYHDIIPEKNAT